MNQRVKYRVCSLYSCLLEKSLFRISGEVKNFPYLYQILLLSPNVSGDHAGRYKRVIEA